MVNMTDGKIIAIIKHCRTELTYVDPVLRRHKDRSICCCQFSKMAAKLLNGTIIKGNIVVEGVYGKYGGFKAGKKWKEKWYHEWVEFDGKIVDGSADQFNDVGNFQFPEIIFAPYSAYPQYRKSPNQK